MAAARCPDLITVDDNLDSGSGGETIREICREQALPVYSSLRSRRYQKWLPTRSSSPTVFRPQLPAAMRPRSVSRSLFLIRARVCLWLVRFRSKRSPPYPASSSTPPARSIYRISADTSDIELAVEAEASTPSLCHRTTPPHPSVPQSRNRAAPTANFVAHSALHRPTTVEDLQRQALVHRPAGTPATRPKPAICRRSS